ncbi:MAG TPA: endonuclease domain-containing protein [Chitinophagaceae bacterium]
MHSIPRWRGPDLQFEYMIERGWTKLATNCNFQIVKRGNNNYNKNLQPYANKLRKEMTKAEACLWKYILKARQLNGYQFRRQRTVLKYIADFMCMELMLIIEVDGITHHWEETMIKDKKKQGDLEAAGFTVLRFTDEEVLKNINSVHAFLVEWIIRKENSRSTPK